jgi:hypothetical protein
MSSYQDKLQNEDLLGRALLFNRSQDSKTIIADVIEFDFSPTGNNKINVLFKRPKSLEDETIQHLIRIAQDVERARIAEDRQRQESAGMQYKAEYNERERVSIKERREFYAIDIGTSGAFLIRKSDGEIFNIKSCYGVPDYNKKLKADLGNIKTADGQTLYRRRYNYLR